MTDAPADPRADIGVVIVTYNSGDHVQQLTTSLRAALDGLDHQVVVVDNASSDDTVARVRAAGFDLVEMGHNSGYSAGINAGLAEVKDTRAVLILNPDVVIDAAAVRELIRALDDSAVGIVVPQTRRYDGVLSPNQRRDPSLLRAIGSTFLGANRASRWGRLSEIVADERKYLRVEDIDWGVGAVMLISRACAEAVGEWDETFFLYSEEIDYCQRARSLGFRVRYVPSAVVFHEGGGGVRNPRLRSMMTVNKVRFYARHHRRLAGWAFFTVSLLYEVTRGVAGSQPARAAALALLLPSRRPPEIRCSTSLLPL